MAFKDKNMDLSTLKEPLFGSVPTTQYPRTAADKVAERHAANNANFADANAYIDKADMSGEDKHYAEVRAASTHTAEQGAIDREEAAAALGHTVVINEVESVPQSIKVEVLQHQ